MPDKATWVRPTDEELDLYGITHKGNVRSENQDHFLVSTVHPQVVVHATSLPNPESLPLRGTRLATVLVLADGVGGTDEGSEAARLATEAVTRYVSSTLRSYHAAGSSTESELLDALKAAALEAHEAVRAESARRADHARMATTLTVCIVVYPWAYVVQVGDSRAYFFTNGDSRDPELAGIWGATVGSFFMLLVTLALSFPLGVATAIYLEEFARRNRWTDLIEVNINNLAAVPSIVFGLLGLALFINAFGLPRSAPLVGGLVLSLMTLPVIIIASRAALTAVPPSIREAALGLGASKMQVVLHHVLPLAMPGMLTGTIIGMARALGESAPLLMIGMVAFIVDTPESPLSPATALPVQVYLWADSPERAFVERTSAAIVVLLLFLLVMNATAILLRKRFERRY